MGLFDFISRKKIDELNKQIESLKRAQDLTEIKRVHAMVEPVAKETKIFPRLFEKNGGWMYEILDGDSPVVVQDCYPGASGFQMMTFNEAKMFSDEIVARLREAEHGDNEQ